MLTAFLLCFLLFNSPLPHPQQLVLHYLLFNLNAGDVAPDEKHLTK